MDPVYAAVFERIRETADPVLDVGCGVGILAAYLRARGFGAAIRGIDHDERKVAVARRVIEDATFEVGDARTAMGAGGTVVLLDLLHYFGSGDQAAILGAAAAYAKTVIMAATTGNQLPSHSGNCRPTRRALVARPMVRITSQRASITGPDSR